MQKAILVVSFGTTYLETLQKNIETMENRIRETFPGYEVRRAFTSRMVARRLKEKHGLSVDNEKEALARLQADGYREVFIQPLHVVPGEEFDKVRLLAVHSTEGFEQIKVGRPLLFYAGQEEQPDDYGILIDALRPQLTTASDTEGVVLMGHGGVHPANMAYAALQLKLEEAGLSRVFVYTVEGFPSLDSIINKLKKQGIAKVMLMPFMLVAGDHALNDMAGDEPDSAKSLLAEAGIRAEVLLKGLGENPAVQEIYIQHLHDIISQSDK